MPFPATIHTAVGQSLIGKVSRLFNNGVGDVLTELLQNARRAGASRVEIDVIDVSGRSTLVVRDDGSGIEDPAKLLTLGDSGWNESIAQREDPAGMGVFSLAGRHVEVRSYSQAAGRGWRVVIAPDAWENGAQLVIENWDIAVGTELRIAMPEAWSRELDAAAANAARHYPLPVLFQGEELKRTDYLVEACRVEEWNGCRIGVFFERTHLPKSYPRINFHGLTVLCPMPSVSEIDVGECWHVRVDIVDAPALQLVLPARKEMVQNAALEALREAAERAIYRTIAARGGHRLAHAGWLRARELGIDLPEAEPWLWAWLPRTSDGQDTYNGERVAGMPMILFSHDEPLLEQCAARALKTGDALGGALVHEVPAFAGYGWYDGLPRISSLSFLVQTNGGMFRYEGQQALPADLQSGPVIAITLDVTVAQSLQGADICASYSLAADVLIVPDDGWSVDLDQTLILLSTGHAITSNDLADLLEAACFCARDDVDDDSWQTQQRNFEIRARQIANALLLGEDASVIERIRDVVHDEIGWFIPQGRKITMLAGGGQVELAFVEEGAASESD